MTPRSVSRRPRRGAFPRSFLSRRRLRCLEQSLSATRKKRKVAPEYVKPAELKNYVQTAAITSLHGTKPPGIAALDLAKSGSLIVTGGFVLPPSCPYPR